MHVALGQANSPVQQGATAADSVRNFSSYVYNKIMVNTQCSREVNGVRHAEGLTRQKTYFTELLQRVDQDTYHSLCEFLADTFIHNNTATAQWSVSVSTPAGQAGSVPPATSLGAMVVVRGGVGLGKVAMEEVHFMMGVFK